MPRLQRTFAIVGAGVGALAGGVSIYKTLHSASQEKKDRAEASRLKQPFLKVQDDYIQNQNLAREQATGGIPIDTKNFIDSKREQGLSSTLSTLQKTGASPDEFARANQLFGDSLKSEASDDAMMHIENIKQLMSVNKDIAGQKTNQWTVNEYAPYESKLKEITERRAADVQNMWNGISEGIGSLSAIGTSLQGTNFGRNRTEDTYVPDRIDTSGAVKRAGTQYTGSPADNFKTLDTTAPTLQ